jgi:hypothetical protein
MAPGVLDNVEFLVIIITYYEHGMGLLKGGIGPRGIGFLLVFWIGKKGLQVAVCRGGTTLHVMYMRSARRHKASHLAVGVFIAYNADTAGPTNMRAKFMQEDRKICEISTRASIMQIDSPAVPFKHKTSCTLS